MSDVLVPAGPYDITPTWLEHALAPRYPGVRVRSVEAVEVRQVTNTHAFLRVEYEDAHGAPARMFCKMLPLDPDRRTVLAASQMGPKEVLFYERLAPHLALRVPDVYVARHDPRDESFVLLMEDLSASACRVSTFASRTRGGGWPRCRGPHWPNTFPPTAWRRSATASTIIVTG
jgi:hypothetical protein